MNNLRVLLIISCVPDIVMGAYINKKDKDKEPSYLLKKLFWYGVLSIFPILALELFARNFISVDKNLNPFILFINIFISVALIEEGAKWVIINKTIYYDKNFNHVYDAIIYSVFVSLGFALVENVMYVLGSNAITGILRGVTAIPCHTCDGIIMGYFMGKAKSEEYKNNYSLSKKYMFYSLLCPIMLHTFYDFSIFLQNNYSLILLPIITIFIFIISYILIKKVSQVEFNFDGKQYMESLTYQVNSNGICFKYAMKMMLAVSISLIMISSFFIHI